MPTPIPFNAPRGSFQPRTSPAGRNQRALDETNRQFEAMQRLSAQGARTVGPMQQFADWALRAIGGVTPAGRLPLVGDALNPRSSATWSTLDAARTSTSAAIRASVNPATWSRSPMSTATMAATRGADRNFGHGPRPVYGPPDSLNVPPRRGLEPGAVEPASRAPLVGPGLGAPVPHVTPPRRAQDSNLNAMAQQYDPSYWENATGKAMLELAQQQGAPGKTSADLRRYYDAQRDVGIAFNDDVVAGLTQELEPERAAAIKSWAEANPALALREYNKRYPIERAQSNLMEPEEQESPARLVAIKDAMEAGRYFPSEGSPNPLARQGDMAGPVVAVRPALIDSGAPVAFDRAAAGAPGLISAQQAYGTQLDFSGMDTPLANGMTLRSSFHSPSNTRDLSFAQANDVYGRQAAATGASTHQAASQIAGNFLEEAKLRNRLRGSGEVWR